MFLKTYYLINKNPFNFETKLVAVITFMNEQKYYEFIQSNRYFWLQNELGLPESYFWNVYLEEPDVYINEVDNEYIIDKLYQQADKFTIK